MRKILLFLALTLAATTATAETQASKQSRYVKMLQSVNLDSKYVSTILALINNPQIYDTSAELLAATPTEGTIAYAADANTWYVRSASSWESFASAPMANGATITNGTNNVIDYFENSERVSETFGANAIDFSSNTGVAEMNFTGIALQASVVATQLGVARFCGNGSATGAAHYMGPVLLADIIDGTGGAQDPVDTSFGSSFCDGLDNATEGTADRVFTTTWAIKPVAMACVGRCTGASAANDSIVYQLRDDTADVTGMTCTAAAWSGDDVPSQCTVRDPTPATVAANSAIAVKFTGTNDACDAGGDDFECFLYYTY